MLSVLAAAWGLGCADAISLSACPGMAAQGGLRFDAHTPPPLGFLRGCEAVPPSPPFPPPAAPPAPPPPPVACSVELVLRRGPAVGRGAQGPAAQGGGGAGGGGLDAAARCRLLAAVAQAELVDRPGLPPAWPGLAALCVSVQLTGQAAAGGAEQAQGQQQEVEVELVVGSLVL